MNTEKISMPRCCAACDHYKHKGRIDDEKSPFVDIWGRNTGRSMFGNCALHSKDVYFNQICNSFTAPEDLLEVRAVQNRGEAMQPIQEDLL